MLIFGSLADRFGRERPLIACVLFLSTITILSGFAPNYTFFLAMLLALALGSCFMQTGVQGAFGVIPAHLNELSPAAIRSLFPGFVYQLGNLLASANATIQAGIAAHFGGNYGLAMALVAGSVAVIIAVLTSVGVEAKGVAFGSVRRLRTAA